MTFLDLGIVVLFGGYSVLAVYLVAGVLGLAAVAGTGLWGVVAAFRRPRFVVPPHLRDYEEE